MSINEGRQDNHHKNIYWLENCIEIVSFLLSGILKLWPSMVLHHFSKIIEAFTCKMSHC